MIVSHDDKQPRLKNAVETKNSSGKVTAMPSATPATDLTRERAYELYERRGREPGQEVQDWLRAEQEVLSRKP
jgi:hypothetical protein